MLVHVKLTLGKMWVKYVSVCGISLYRGQLAAFSIAAPPPYPPAALLSDPKFLLKFYTPSTRDRSEAEKKIVKRFSI